MKTIRWKRVNNKRPRWMTALAITLLMTSVGIFGLAAFTIPTSPTATHPPIHHPFIAQGVTVPLSGWTSCVSVTTCVAGPYSVNKWDYLEVAIVRTTTTLASAVQDNEGHSLVVQLAPTRCGASNLPCVFGYRLTNGYLGVKADYKVWVNYTVAATYLFSVIDLRGVNVNSGTNPFQADSGASGLSGTTYSFVWGVTAPAYVVTALGSNAIRTFTAISPDILASQATNKGSLSTQLSGDINTQNVPGSGAINVAVGSTLNASANGALLSVAWNPAVLLGAPMGLAAGTVTTTTVPLTWTIAPAVVVMNVTVYQAPYSAGSCGAYSTHYSVGNVTAYTVTGLTSGNAYCFKVTQWNGAGESPASTPITNVVTAHVPPKPTSLTLTVPQQTTTEISVSWTNPVGTLTADTVYYGTSCGSLTFTVPLAGGTNTTLVTGLTANTAYCFAVTATNATGESVKSATQSATTNFIPAAPTTLGVGTLTPTTAIVTWSNPSGTLVNDTVYYGTTCANLQSRRSLSAGVGSTATLTGLNAQTTYCFTVQAWSQGGPGSIANPFLNFTTTTGAPSPPTFLANNTPTQTSVRVSWVQGVPSGGSIANDTVYVYSAFNASTRACVGSLLFKDSVGGAFLSYTATGLSSGTNYCVTVTAWSQGGQSAVANPALNITTLYATPNAPTGLSQVSGSRSQILANWTNPVNVPLVNVTLWYSAANASGCSGTKTAVSVGVAMNYTISGLVPFTTYRVIVAAFSTGGQGALSSCVAMVSQNATPPAPLHLTVLMIGATWVTLQWTNPTPYILYNNTVYVASYTSICLGYFEAFSTHGVAHNFNVTGLGSGSSYCFTVTAWDGQSPHSAPVTATTQGTSGPIVPLPFPSGSPYETLGFLAAALVFALIILAVIRRRRSR